MPRMWKKQYQIQRLRNSRIEDELERLFPDASVLRMDADTTSAKFSHQKLFDAFSRGDYDILIGTQMVAKGLDFPNVTLVGVVNADNSLYDESYLANERSFDLITQVVGRSGRRAEAGKAVIQTINPYNDVIEYASKQDYKSFLRTKFNSESCLHILRFAIFISYLLYVRMKTKRLYAQNPFLKILWNSIRQIM